MFFRQPEQQKKDEIEILLDKVYGYQQKINLVSDTRVRCAAAIHKFLKYSPSIFAPANLYHAYVIYHCQSRAGLINPDTNMLVADYIDGKIVYNQNYFTHAVPKFINNIFTHAAYNIVPIPVGSHTGIGFAPKIEPQIVFDYNNDGIFHENGETEFCQFFNDYSKILFGLTISTQSLNLLSYYLEWQWKTTDIFKNQEYMTCYEDTETFFTSIKDDYDYLGIDEKRELLELGLLDNDYHPKFYCPIALGFAVNPILIESVDKNGNKYRNIYDFNHVYSWVNDHYTDPYTMQPITTYGFSPAINKEHREYFRDLARKINEFKSRNECRLG